ncbi:hypothetical protein EDD85DRAFT_946573 [Armillaria nabsnona]|nr:hypothetical protein EDD85DRAFT_946573 [Armillaria nabsnona]
MEILSLAGRSNFMSIFIAGLCSAVLSTFIIFTDVDPNSMSVELNDTVWGEFRAAILVLLFELHCMDACNVVIGDDVMAAYATLFPTGPNNIQAGSLAPHTEGAIHRSACVASLACQTYRIDSEQCNQSGARSFLAQGKKFISSVIECFRQQ